MTALKKLEILGKLQADILRIQGIRLGNEAGFGVGPEVLKSAFPGGTLPFAAIHEFLVEGEESTAPSRGFIAGLVGSFMKDHGTVLWVSKGLNVFPPGLETFGIRPDRIIFITIRNNKEKLWVLEEALKCTALTAVVGELSDLTFLESRRLQLAVEQSRVTGFVIRNCRKKLSTTACVSRWKILSLPSEPIGDLPGIGYPSWRVELLRIRNGKPGVWDLMWANGKFEERLQIHSELFNPRVETNQKMRWVKGL